MPRGRKKLSIDVKIERLEKQLAELKALKEVEPKESDIEPTQ
jgi:hypothetical protein